MATAWQSLEEAALTLGISSRTLHRRLAKGEFQTRLESGRREVLVSVEDMTISANASVAANTVADTFRHATAPPFDPLADRDDQASDASADVGHPVLALHEDRIRRTDLAIMAYQQSVIATANDARRAHRNSRVAWSLAGVTVTALFVSVVWATHTVTKAQGEVTHLNQVVRQLSDTTDSQAKQADAAHKDAETARILAARAEGELSAARSQIAQLADSKAALEDKFVIANAPTTVPALSPEQRQTVPEQLPVASSTPTTAPAADARIAQAAVPTTRPTPLPSPITASATVGQATTAPTVSAR